MTHGLPISSHALGVIELFTAFRHCYWISIYCRSILDLLSISFENFSTSIVWGELLLVNACCEGGYLCEICPEGPGLTPFYPANWSKFIRSAQLIIMLRSTSYSGIILRINFPIFSNFYSVSSEMDVVVYCLGMMDYSSSTMIYGYFLYDWIFFFFCCRSISLT